MDKLMNKLSGGSSGASQPQQPGAQNDDVVDKITSKVAGKEGLNVSKEQQEKITDGARNAYEKATGNQVNPKISN